MKIEQVQESNYLEGVNRFLNSIDGKYKNRYQNKFRQFFEELKDVAIYSREAIEPYNKFMQQYALQIFPIVDQKLNIVIITTTKGKHNEITKLLYAYANGQNPEVLDDDLMNVYADNFLASGQGYYLTGANIGTKKMWLMGDAYVMDDNDKKFLLGEMSKIKKVRSGSVIAGIAYI